MLRDKSWIDSISSLLPLANRIIAVPVKSERSLSPTELAAFCTSGEHLSGCEVLECQSLSDALEMTESDPITVITGSLYLMGEAMTALGLAPQDNLEPPLNEWSQASASMPAAKNLSAGASGPKTEPESRAG
jgi:folylpolyglutamate synthase/dihydropteroate synthase